MEETIKPYRERIIQAAREYQRKVEKDYPVMPSYLSQISAQIREAFYCGFELFEKDNADLLAKVSEQEKEITELKEQLRKWNLDAQEAQGQIELDHYKIEDQAKAIQTANDYIHQANAKILSQFKEISEQSQRIQELKEEKVIFQDRIRVLDKTLKENHEQGQQLWEQQAKRIEELENDLRDALDLKEGKGPTALTILKSRTEQLEELLKRCESHIDMEGGADELVNEIKAALK